jgi:hypothetical protein
MKKPGLLDPGPSLLPYGDVYLSTLALQALKDLPTLHVAMLKE